MVLIYITFMMKGLLPRFPMMLPLRGHANNRDRDIPSEYNPFILRVRQNLAALLLRNAGVLVD